MTVLYIDDDEEDKEVFGEALRMVNDSIQYTCASHGMEALEILNNHDTLPDFIFLDVLMPLMDGGEFLKAIKKDNRLRNIPIVLCTNDLTPQIHLEFQELGVINILIMPRTFDELIKCLYLILK